MAKEENEYDRYVPDHLKANYRQLVEERHDGDWHKLARALDANGESVVAKWAASQAEGSDDSDESENAMAKTETTKRGPGRPRKDA